MNVKALKGDATRIANQYVESGDSVTIKETKAVLRAARKGQLMGVFDHGRVVALVAVDPNTASILDSTALPGVDVSGPVTRIIDHFEKTAAPASQGYADVGSDYRKQARSESDETVGYQYDDRDALFEGGYPDEGYQDGNQGDYGYQDDGYAYADDVADTGYGQTYRDDPAAMGLSDADESEFIRSWGNEPDAEPQPQDDAAQFATLTSNQSLQSTSPRIEKRRHGAGAVVLSVILIFAAVGAGIYLTGVWKPFAQQFGLIPSDDANKEVPRPTEPVHITVPDGYGSAQIGQLLLDAGLVDSLDTFHKETVKQSAESSMKSGSYVFGPDMTLSEIIALLVSGPNDSSARLTVPEGLSVARVAELADRQFGIPANEFMDRAKASNYVGDYPFLSDVAEDSLEGFMYPGTYDFEGKTPDADGIIRTLLDQFSKNVSMDDLNACKDAINAEYNLELSWYDILKVSSIVEREATNNDDRPKVASVFYNRLGKVFPGLGYVRPYLESDATMAYVVGHEVTPEDLKQESPYNTYLTKGLPPTPIASPSPESLEAAKHPAQTNNFYFLIVEEDGYSNHTFSETYEQHQEAIAAVKRDRNGE